MDLICLDFESYYDPAIGYTLKKMTNEEYVRDSRFEPLCIGVARAGHTPTAVPQEELEAYINSIDWHNVALVCHHAHFDGLILAHHYGVKPRLWLCTLSMARALNYPRGMSLSLEALSEHHNLPPKTVPYNAFVGKRWADMDEELRQLMLAGAARDAENTLELAEQYLKRFPREELISIDWTIRAYTEPQLIGDAVSLNKIAADEARRKAELLVNLGLTREDVASNDKFAHILEGLGVEVERKTNSKGQLIPAVAKSDSFMKSLLEHEDSLVVDLAETRLAVKSTQRETRAGRMADMAVRGPMPIYYYFCGAQNTTRHAGGDKMNWQNLERGGAIRKSIVAPEGHKLIIADKSQIECRILNTACGQDDVVEMFRDGVDIYCRNASMVYGKEITKKDNPTERGTGKQIELSCGYGVGATKYCATAALGIYGPPVLISMSEGKRHVDFYRRMHPMVVAAWAQGDYILRQWDKEGIKGSHFSLMGIDYIDGYAILPSGLALDYTSVIYDGRLGQHFFQHKKSFARNVSPTPPDGEAERWEWWYRRGYRTLYGAKMVEQLTQALSAVDYRQSANRLYSKHGLRPAMSSHDEAVYVVSESRAEELAVTVEKEFSTPPAWVPNLPSAAEIIISSRYDK